MFVLSLPTWIQVSKDKRFYLNLNQYRNTHFRTLDKAKKLFHKQVEPQIALLPFLGRVKLVFTLYPPFNHNYDTSNVCSIAEKFFNDALVAEKKLADDRFDIVIESTYRYGNVDKSNPRVEVAIETLGE